MFAGCNERDDRTDGKTQFALGHYVHIYCSPLVSAFEFRTVHASCTVPKQHIHEAVPLQDVSNTSRSPDRLV